MKRAYLIWIAGSKQQETFSAATVHSIVSLLAIQYLSSAINLELWCGSEPEGSVQDKWLSWHLCKMEGQASSGGPSWVRDGLCILGQWELFELEDGVYVKDWVLSTDLVKISPIGKKLIFVYLINSNTFCCCQYLVFASCVEFSYHLKY